MSSSELVEKISIKISDDKITRFTLFMLISGVFINVVPLFSQEMSPNNVEINTIPCSTLNSADTTFTTTAKVSAVVMGSFFGFFLGGTIGALSIEQNDDRVRGVLMGGGSEPLLAYF
ncbi:hypothetical protein GX408_05745 [bacterium]|nr:hypothetical protein [bacterium]